MDLLAKRVTEEDRRQAVPMKMGNLIETIYHIYFAKVEADARDEKDGNGHTTLPHFCYEFFLERESLAQSPVTPERRMFEIIWSVQRLSKSEKGDPRISMFASFLGLASSDEGDPTDTVMLDTFLALFSASVPKRKAKALPRAQTTMPKRLGALMRMDGANTRLAISSNRGKGLLQAKHGIGPAADDGPSPDDLCKWVSFPEQVNPTLSLLMNKEIRQ